MIVIVHTRDGRMEKKANIAIIDDSDPHYLKLYDSKGVTVDAIVKLSIIRIEAIP